MNQKTSRILRQYLIINKKMGYHPYLNSSGQETYMQGKDSNRKFKQQFEALSDKEKNKKLETMKREIAAFREKLDKPDFTEYKEKVEKLREKLHEKKIKKLSRNVAFPYRWFNYRSMANLSKYR